MNQNVRFANPLKVISTEADKAKEAMSGVGEKMSSVGQAVASGNAEIEQSTDAASKGLDDVAESGEKARGSLEGVSQAEGKASKETSKFKTALSSVKSAFKGMKMPFAEFLSSIKRIAMYRLLRSIIKQITQGFMEAYHAMYRWSQAGNDNNQFAESMDKIATALHYIHASLSALASPIINALAPAIDWLADRFVNLLNIINQVLATINNQSGWTRAIKKQITYGDTLSDTNKKAKELKKTLLGIDEINLLNGQTNSSTTDTDALYDFEWVKFDKDNGIYNFFKDMDWGEVIGHLATILAIIEGIKLAWKGANFLGGLALGSAAAYEFWSAFSDVFTKQMDEWTALKLLAGTVLAIAAGALIGKAFGHAAGGAAIGAIVAGVVVAVAAIIDMAKNGINWINTIAMYAGYAIAGVGLALVLGISGWWGILIAFILGTITLTVMELVTKWDFIWDIWKNAYIGLLHWAMNIGNFVISIIEWIANTMVKLIINPILSLVNFLSHTNFSIGNISIPKFDTGDFGETWNELMSPETTGKLYTIYQKVKDDVDWNKVVPYLREAIATGKAPEVKPEDQEEVDKMFFALNKNTEETKKASDGLMGAFSDKLSILGNTLGDLNLDSLTSSMKEYSSSLDGMMDGLNLDELSSSLSKSSFSMDNFLENFDVNSLSTELSNLATEASNFGADGTIAVDLETLISKVETIIGNQITGNNKQGDVYLDGDKVGKVMSKKSFIEKKSLDMYNQVGVLTY